MSITTEFVSSTNKSIRIDVDEITTIANGQNKTLFIILTVTLPTLACIAILTIIIICYRRRNATISLKKSDNANRLQAIIVNLSPTSIQPPYN